MKRFKTSALDYYMFSYCTIKGTDEGLSIWQALFLIFDSAKWRVPRINIKLEGLNAASGKPVCDAPLAAFAFGPINKVAPVGS